MDLIIKITIFLFCFTFLLIFFKVTKKMGENYDKKNAPVETPIDKSYENILQELENPQTIDEQLDNFEWKIGG